ncbi:MAG TPA: aspartate--tRNA(Asn) ligase, partial [Actinomycetes bacterium]|nr:aspartate--tRNA(Asn) ligase [Actinomycetes bacterium]
MNRILSTDLAAHAGRQVVLAGWVHRRRQLAAVSFLVLRDRAGLAQIVVRDEAARAALAGIGEESAVRIHGPAVANPAAPGGVEVVDPVIEVLAPAAEPPPVELHRPVLSASLPTILDTAHVTLRHPRLAAVHRIAAAAVSGFRQTLDAQDFVAIHTPKIVAAATESGANVFALDYFGRPAYLAQSPQLYKQIMVGVFERVYEIGPAFRAEPHDTARHLASFTSLDVELGFVDDHRPVMAVLRDVMAGMVEEIRAHAGAAVELLDLTLPEVPPQIPTLHFAEALELVGTGLGEDLSAEPDLAPGHERWLCEWSVRELGSEFVLVEGYPTAARAFYTHPDPARPGYSRGFDLLFRGLELVSGAQRLHRYDDYVAALTERGDDPADFTGYLDAFRHGMPPHGGFAIGLERW